MKKLILVCALTIIYLGSFAQIDSTRKNADYDMNKNKNNNQDNKQNKNSSKEYQKNDNTNKDCAMTMANGKMMMVVDGKTVVMEKQMTTKNGSVVMMDGTVKTKDGITTKMKNGDCMDMSDKMIVVKNTQVKENSKIGTK